MMKPIILIFTLLIITLTTLGAECQGNCQGGCDTAYMARIEAFRHDNYMAVDKFWNDLPALRQEIYFAVKGLDTFSKENRSKMPTLSYLFSEVDIIKATVSDEQLEAFRQRKPIEYADKMAELKDIISFDGRHDCQCGK
jgi:hypothetical protein